MDSPGWMGAEHFMSRRNILVNTLLGFFLISVFALLFFLAVGALGVVLKAGNLFITRFWPQLAHSQDTIFLGLIASVVLTSAIGHLRKRRWQNAFLSFGIAAAMLSIWLAPSHSLGGQPALALVPWTFFLIFAILPGDVRLTRFEFILGNSIVAALVAINAGLLGPDRLSNVVAICAQLAIVLLMVLHVRQNWRPTTTPQVLPDR
jgi:hypothetical protein